jgi:hypothetical protein
MSTLDPVVTVALASIGTDLAVHLWNYGFPVPTNIEFFNSESGLAFAGTVSGIAATSTASGVTAEELKSSVNALGSDYQRRLARVVIASSAVNVKMLTQVGVGTIYALAFARSQEELGAWTVKQVLPTLFLHGAMAGIIPYFM